MCTLVVPSWPVLDAPEAHDQLIQRNQFCQCAALYDDCLLVWEALSMTVLVIRAYRGYMLPTDIGVCAKQHSSPRRYLHSPKTELPSSPSSQK